MPEGFADVFLTTFHGNNRRLPWPRLYSCVEEVVPRKQAAQNQKSISQLTHKNAYHVK